MHALQCAWPVVVVIVGSKSHGYENEACYLLCSYDQSRVTDCDERLYFGLHTGQRYTADKGDRLSKLTQKQPVCTRVLMPSF